MLLPRTSEREILTLVPLGKGATAHNAAHQLASTASAQGRSVALVDLEDGSATQLPLPPGGTDVDPPPGPQSLRERWPNSLNGSGFPIFGDPGNGSVQALLDDLERDFSLVVIALPTIDQPRAIGALSPERPVVIVVRPGKVSRGELQEAVISLQQAGITTLGVILE
jgi:Mrp family chromosome partitioning ATPase